MGVNHSYVAELSLEVEDWIGRFVVDFAGSGLAMSELSSVELSQVWW